MKKNWLFVIPGAVILAGIVMAVVFLSGRSGQAAADTPQKENSAPKAVAAPLFEGANLSGKGTVSLSNYAGQVVLVNFWATWCPPCRAEIPDLIALHEKYRGRFAVIGIALDQDGPDVVRRFIRENRITYPVIMGTPEVVQAYGGITAIPTSYLVNKKGEAVEQIVGYRPKDQYEELILKYLE